MQAAPSTHIGNNACHVGHSCCMTQSFVQQTLLSRAAACRQPALGLRQHAKPVAGQNGCSKHTACIVNVIVVVTAVGGVLAA